MRVVRWRDRGEGGTGADSPDSVPASLSRKWWPAEHTLLVGGEPFRFCAVCYAMASWYLADQQVHATEISVPGPAASRPAVPAAPALSGTAPPARLLVVEDDDAVREALRVMLTRRGYEVLVEGTGRDGLRSSCLRRPDLVLLDVMLPDFDGMQLLRRLRTVSDVPVIFLTARSAPIDVVVGLESGADDYITKPCDSRELDARIRRVLYRYRAAEGRRGGIFDDGLLRLDSEQCRAWASGLPLSLSVAEFRVLDRLVRRAGTVQHFATLLEAGWDVSDPGAQGRVKFAVSRLRGKLDATPVGGGSIVSVRGIGYLYRSPAAPPLPAARPPSTPGAYGHAHALRNL